MTCTDQDTWDLASSVWATATMVAAARALASISLTASNDLRIDSCEPSDANAGGRLC